MVYKKWTEEEERYLKKYYGIKTMKEIQEKLQRSHNSIFKKAKRLNLTVSMKRWNEEEINYLTERWGYETIEKIANKLKRSTNSVKKKANELNLGPSRIANGDFLTTGDIGYLLNKNPNLICKWIKKGYIRGRRFGVGKIFQVRIDDFIIFLKKHPHRWDASKVKIDFIKPYLHTKFRLPNWFQEKVDNDLNLALQKNIFKYNKYLTKSYKRNEG